MDEKFLQKVAVIIPCFNEEEGIGAVIKSFPYDDLQTLGFDLEVIVVDNNSTDGTADVARSHGATVLHEKKKGKGNAMRTGFAAVNPDIEYIVMLDGDNTYRSDEILYLLEPLRIGVSDVVIGSRLNSQMVKGSMKLLNKTGNKLFSTLVRIFYGAKVTDVLTGYYAWKAQTLAELHPHLVSEGFSIEMEMITKMARLGHTIHTVPISYDTRAGQTNLRPFQDGLRILRMFLANLLWTPESKKVVAQNKKSILEAQ